MLGLYVGIRTEKSIYKTLKYGKNQQIGNPLGHVCSKIVFSKHLKQEFNANLSNRGSFSQHIVTLGKQDFRIFSRFSTREVATHPLLKKRVYSTPYRAVMKLPLPCMTEPASASFSGRFTHLELKVGT